MTKSRQPITPDESAWDSFVRDHPRGHLLQLSAWGAHKRAFGWGDDRIALTNADGQVIAGALLLFRPLPLRLGTMAYLPMGPLFNDETDSATRAGLWHAIHERARKNGAAFLKWEPGIFDDDSAAQPDFAALGFRQSPQTVQPPRTILIDITGDDDAIMARMNQGTRRKIRQSMKKDITYYEAPGEEIEHFTELMRVTGQRNEFGVHSHDYYALAYDLFVPSGDGALILAAHEGDILAGIMVFAVGGSAWYLYGASSNHKRNLMASYGVQWRAIEWARARGCLTYDMWGIPDEDEATLEAEFQNRNDDLWGVYGFKRGWGGRIIRSLGAWDHPYNRLIYAAYRAALKLRS